MCVFWGKLHTTTKKKVKKKGGGGGGETGWGGGGEERRENSTCDIKSHSACHHLMTLIAFDTIDCGKLRDRKPYN